MAVVSPAQPRNGSAGEDDVLQLRTRRISLSFIAIMGLVVLALIPIFFLVVGNSAAGFGATGAAVVAAVSLLLVYRGRRQVGNAIFFAVCLAIPIGVGIAGISDPTTLPTVMISVVALLLILLIPTGVLISPGYSAVATVAAAAGFIGTVYSSGNAQLVGRVPLFAVIFLFAGAVIFFFSRIQNELMTRSVQSAQEQRASLDQLHELMHQMEKLRAKATSGSEFMAASLQEIDEIVSTYAEHVEAAAGQSERLGNEVSESQERLGELKAALGRMISSIGEQGSVVDRNAERQRDMAASIESLRNDVNETEARNNELEETSNRGREGVDRILKAIQAVEGFQTQLQDINQVMARIAAQTNLLAMNASIEAAHAGDAGRGFAVVANEIRNLSDEANTRTKEVGGIIKEMSGAISEAARVGDDTGHALIDITEGVAAAAPMVRNLRAAIEQYKSGIDAMVQDTENLVSITRQIGEDADGQGTRLQNYDATFTRVLEAAHSISGTVSTLHEYNAKTKTIVESLSEVRRNQDAVNAQIDELMRTAQADGSDQA
ncbi:MAG: methyl-accepting chemotaxis protein [Spirochaetota bacterium]